MPPALRARFLIGLGLIKKLMIADYLAGNLVNRVFDFPNLYTGAENLIAVYSYTLQLYYDFSGYTDIAIGSALLLGIKLPANFNRPYAAHNIAGSRGGIPHGVARGFSVAMLFVKFDEINFSAVNKMIR